MPYILTANENTLTLTQAHDEAARNKQQKPVAAETKRRKERRATAAALAVSARHGVDANGLVTLLLNAKTQTEREDWCRQLLQQLREPVKTKLGESFGAALTRLWKERISDTGINHAVTSAAKDATLAGRNSWDKLVGALNLQRVFSEVFGGALRAPLLLQATSPEKDARNIDVPMNRVVAALNVGAAMVDISFVLPMTLEREADNIKASPSTKDSIATRCIEVGVVGDGAPKVTVGKNDEGMVTIGIVCLHSMQLYTIAAGPGHESAPWVTVALKEIDRALEEMRIEASATKNTEQSKYLGMELRFWAMGDGGWAAHVAQITGYSADHGSIFRTLDRATLRIASDASLFRRTYADALFHGTAAVIADAAILETESKAKAVLIAGARATILDGDELAKKTAAIERATQRRIEMAQRASHAEHLGWKAVPLLRFALTYTGDTLHLVRINDVSYLAKLVVLTLLSAGATIETMEKFVTGVRETDKGPGSFAVEISNYLERFVKKTRNRAGESVEEKRQRKDSKHIEGKQRTARLIGDTATWLLLHFQAVIAVAVNCAAEHYDQLQAEVQAQTRIKFVTLSQLASLLGTLAHNLSLTAYESPEHAQEVLTSLTINAKQYVMLLSLIWTDSELKPSVIMLLDMAMHARLFYNETGWGLNRLGCSEMERSHQVTRNIRVKRTRRDKHQWIDVITFIYTSLVSKDGWIAAEKKTRPRKLAKAEHPSSISFIFGYDHVVTAEELAGMDGEDGDEQPRLLRMLLESAQANGLTDELYEWLHPELAVLAADAELVEEAAEEEMEPTQKGAPSARKRSRVVGVGLLSREHRTDTSTASKK
jgi:hypothetical protein